MEKPIIQLPPSIRNLSRRPREQQSKPVETASPGKIDYDREYLERFEKAKQEAEARGLKYEYPHRAGVGWKIHLGVSDNPQDPFTQEVANLVRNNRISFKIGNGGTTTEGKGMTIYIGDRDTTEKLAEELDSQFGDRLPEARPQVRHDDTQIKGNVWARFEASYYPTNSGELHQYGYHGISFLREDYTRVMDKWHAPEDRLTWDQGWDRANMVLEEEFGAFYSGTKGKS